MLRPAVGKVIAGDRRKHDMPEPQTSRRLCHTGGFIGFQGERFGGGDRAEMTVPRAAVSGNHEGSRALAPAFPVVWTPGALADGMEAQILQQMARLLESAAGGEL